MQRAGLLLSVFLLAGLICRAQTTPVPVEKIDSLMLVQRRPSLVLLTAPWCKYCAVQKSLISKNKYFADQAGKLYYAELDAESSRKPIRFNSKVYTYKTLGSATGVNALAEALNGSSALSYPTWIFLNEEYEVVGRYNGVLNDTQLRTVVDSLQMVMKD